MFEVFGQTGPPIFMDCHFSVTKYAVLFYIYFACFLDLQPYYPVNSLVSSVLLKPSRYKTASHTQQFIGLFLLVIFGVLTGLGLLLQGRSDRVAVRRGKWTDY